MNRGVDVGVERMNRTMLDECFRVAGRTTWYENIEQIQADLDKFIEYYNLERSHQGYRLHGHPPAQARERLSVSKNCRRSCSIRLMRSKRSPTKQCDQATQLDRVSGNNYYCTCLYFRNSIDN